MASVKTISKFMCRYTELITRNPKNHVPLPRFPINTDKLIKEYEKDLEKFIATDVVDFSKYKMKKTPKIFPKNYFNYESS